MLREAPKFDWDTDGWAKITERLPGVKGLIKRHLRDLLIKKVIQPQRIAVKFDADDERGKVKVKVVQSPDKVAVPNIRGYVQIKILKHEKLVKRGGGDLICKANVGGLSLTLDEKDWRKGMEFPVEFDRDEVLRLEIRDKDPGVAFIWEKLGRIKAKGKTEEWFYCQKSAGRLKLAFNWVENNVKRKVD